MDSVRFSRGIFIVSILYFLAILWVNTKFISFIDISVVLFILFGIMYYVKSNIRTEVLVFMLLVYILWSISIPYIGQAGDLEFTYTYVQSAYEKNTFLIPMKKTLGYYPHLFIYIYVLYNFYLIIQNLHLTIIFINLILLGISSFFIYKYFLEEYNSKFAIFVVYIWLFCPFNLVFLILGSNIIMFNSFLALTIISSFKMLASDYSVRDMFMAIIFMVVANMVRPVISIVIIALVIAIFWGTLTNQIKLSRKQIIKITTTIVTFFVLSFIFDTMIYTYLKEEVVKSKAGYSVLTGSNLEYGGMWNEEDQEILKEMLEKHDTSERAFQIMQQKGIDRLKSYSLREKYELLKKKFFNFTNIGIVPYDLFNFKPEWRKYEGKLSSLFFMYVLFLLVQSIKVNIRGIKKNKIINSRKLMLTLAVFGYTIASMFLEVSNRYFIPVVVLLLFYSIDEFYISIKNLMECK